MVNPLILTVLTLKGLTMLVKFQTPGYSIYAELDRAERVTHLPPKNRIHPARVMRFSTRLNRVAIFTLRWSLNAPHMGSSSLSRVIFNYFRHRFVGCTNIQKTTCFYKNG